MIKVRTNIITEEFVIWRAAIPSTKDVDVVVVNNGSVGGSTLGNSSFTFNLIHLFSFYNKRALVIELQLILGF